MYAYGEQQAGRCYDRMYRDTELNVHYRPTLEK